jgi:UDP-N-acetylmuramyl pentapeptide phosphotransferase/UDP-N-acetylglucosamine-1-phosphate transferase
VTAEAVYRAVLALALSLVLVPAVLPLLRRYGVVDIPCARSSHTVTVPRGAGLAVMLAVIVAALVPYPGTAPLSGSHDRAVLTVVLGTAALYGLLGFADDLRGLDPGGRLLAQVVFGVVLAWPLVTLLHRGWEWIPLGTVAATSYVNVTNFMDGINGMTGWYGVVAGSAFAGMGAYEDKGWMVALGACLAGACLGFLPFNAVRAKVFLGDVGSYGLGALVAALSGGGFLAGLPTEACLGPLALYLADTGSTLVRRLGRGENWREPHRHHTYQRLTDRGFSHVRVALLVAGLTVVTSALGAVSLTGDRTLRILADVVVLVVVGAYLALPTVLAARDRARTAEG